MTVPSPGRRLVVLIASCVLCAATAGVVLNSAGRVYRRTSDVAWGEMSVDALIDRLADVGKERFELHVAGSECTGFFVPLDSLAKCDGLEGPPSEMPPAFRELVRRGTAALPGLLKHLSDARPTRLHLMTHAYEDSQEHAASQEHLGLGPFADISFYQEYYPRRLPPCTPDSSGPYGAGAGRWGAVLLSDDWQSEDAYTVRVGDLCYTAVGQIVNRELDAIEYQGSNSIALYSPVLRPVLAEAVRRDWSGLRNEEHFQSLVADARIASDDGTWRAVGAVRRLSFYYPDRAEQVLVDLLSRQICDSSAAVDLVYSDLLKSDDEAHWQAHFEEFRAKHGVVAASVAVLLLQSHQEEVCQTIRFLMRPGTSVSSSVGNSRDDYERRYEKIQRLLAALSSPADDLLPADGPVDVFHHAEIVEATTLVESAKVNRAVHDSFLRAKSQPGIEPWILRILARACAERLAGTQYESVYRTFLAELNDE